MNLENVQVGDTLILGLRRVVDSQIVTVDRLTKTQIIVNGKRYRKSNGYSVGKNICWGAARLMIPKEGEIEEIREARLHRKLVNDVDDACHINKLRAMSLEQLRQLNALLETS